MPPTGYYTYRPYRYWPFGFYYRRPRQYYSPPLIVFPGYVYPPPAALPSDYADLLEVALATHAPLPFFLHRRRNFAEKYPAYW